MASTSRFWKLLRQHLQTGGKWQMDGLGQTVDLGQFEFLDRSNLSKENWLLSGLISLICGSYSLTVKEINCYSDFRYTSLFHLF